MIIEAVGALGAPLCAAPFTLVAAVPGFSLLSLTLRFKGFSPWLMCYVSSLFVAVECLLLSL